MQHPKTKADCAVSAPYIAQQDCTADPINHPQGWCLESDQIPNS
jgi:hypothetical protein